MNHSLQSYMSNQPGGRLMKNVVCSFLACVVMCMCGACTSNSRVPVKKIVTHDGQKPKGIFAPGVMVGKTLYLAGRGDGNPGSPDEGYQEKTRRCYDSINQTLKVAGLGMEHIIQTWIMIEDIRRMDEVSEVFRELFPKNPPAVTWIGAAEICGTSEMEITAIAYSDLKDRKIIGPAGQLRSQAVLAGNTLYISGMGSTLPGGGQPKTLEEQARQAMINVETVLKQAGLDFRHVVWSTVYIDNYDNYGIVNKVYSEFFEYGNEPARCTVFVDALPGGSHVQITCVATTDLKSRKVVRPPSMRYGPDELSISRSPAVWAGNTLYLSYQTGAVPGKGIETYDLETQFRQMAQNHIDVLKEAGLELSDLVWAHVFLRECDDFNPMNEIYREYFTSPPGVRTCYKPYSGYEKSNVRVHSMFIFSRAKWDGTY